MKIQFTASRRVWKGVYSALFLGAIICNIFAALDWLSLLPMALIGVILPLIPQARHKKAQYLLWGILALWLIFRFSAILDGAKLLANRMFARSEQTQSYEYTYFAVSGESAVEAAAWLSVLMGNFCLLWGNRGNGALCGVWILAMAYFGVTPGVFWLAALLLAAVLNLLPRGHRWLYALASEILIFGIAFAMLQIAPQPSKAVSRLDDRLRDILAGNSVVYEQTPVPTEVPQPQIIPQPDRQQEQPDHGVQKALINTLFFILAALTLALLFIPAVINDRAAKRREKARAGLDDSDPSAAIRAMYLYAKRWRSLSGSAQEIPADVYAIWQEAAYSDHAMTDSQRETMRIFMKKSAKEAWKEADWKKRLKIRYRHCL